MPPLRAGDVHVWCIALETTPARREALEALLSPEERARAARFRFPRDRDRFIVGHGELRVLLGAYLSRAPRSVRFEVGAYGKPSLHRSRGDAAVAFGFSHSRQFALAAVTRDLEVGVDIEFCQTMPALDDVARRCLTPRQVALLERVPSGRRLDAFYEFWCLREAQLKARGVGLSTPLGTFDPGEPPAMPGTRGDASVGEEWTLCRLAPAPGYVGALAAPSPALAVSCRQWRGGDVC